MILTTDSFGMTLICIHDMAADSNSGKLDGYAPENEKKVKQYLFPFFIPLFHGCLISKS